MEFPDTGMQCSLKECKQLDFLPISCNYCMNAFCKDHFDVMSHTCSKFVKPISEKTQISVITCSQKSCKQKLYIKILCPKCKQPFCFSHQNHECSEANQINKLIQQKKHEILKQEYFKVKNGIDKELMKKLRNTTNYTMSNKIHLMKLKVKSVGPKGIPISERCYFNVYSPASKNGKFFEGSKGVFVSINWSIGKVIDCIAELLKIPNSNNVVNAKKLRIFDYNTGSIVTYEMSLVLLNLIDNNILVDGHNIILEYLSNNKINPVCE